MRTSQFHTLTTAFFLTIMLGWTANLSLAQDQNINFSTTEGTWVSLDVAPDGSLLVFELLGDIFTLPADGGSARALITGRAFQSHPRFSPDGRYLAYISDESGSDNVWISEADGTNSRQISTLPRSGMLSPAWSADGLEVFTTVITTTGF